MIKHQFHVLPLNVFVLMSDALAGCILKFVIKIFLSQHLLDSLIRQRIDPRVAQLDNGWTRRRRWFGNKRFAFGRRCFQLILRRLGYGSRFNLRQTSMNHIGQPRIYPAGLGQLQGVQQGVQGGLTSLQKQLSDTLSAQLVALSEANARRLGEIRTAMQEQMAQLQQSNTAKLEEMRQTVDEKLQSTLQTRLTESFKQVAERLEMVHKGLGEMQTLAQGVGDLKHLLTNVKVRGMFGEAQLGALLEQVFAPDQYGTQVQVHPGSRHAVDFALRLPGKSEDGTPLWLPIDAKFPNEDYERLLEAQQRANPEAAEQAARQLEARIRLEAKAIAERYIAPPHTTDFAILFLPTEGLYAEVLRRPGLMESLQRDHRITLAGPTTLLVMLNAMQMGFKTLALEKRSSEVWQVLGAVKTEFGKFGNTLAKARKQTQTVLNTLEHADTRTRAMQRALRGAEALPEEQAQQLLELELALNDGMAAADANNEDE